MRMTFYFNLVIGIVIALEVGDSSLASAKTVESGDATTSWIGIGEIHDLADEGLVVNAIVKGKLIIRQFKGDMGNTVHTASNVCLVQAIVDKKNNQRTQRGLCTLIANDGDDVAYAQFKCQGDINECEGEFTFLGGARGFSGISGTTQFFNRIIFQKLEAGNAQVVGYARLPNFTYTLP